MPLNIIRNDITKMNVDAIANAANTDLRMGGGVCGAIFHAAGAEKLQAACNKLAPVKTGEAVITKGFSLPAKYVIHTAGPIYRDGYHNEESLLKSCYRNSLDLAKKHGCKSIAFPLIASGVYGYPKEEALAAATGAIREWLNGNDMDITLVVYDNAAFALSQELSGSVKAFIDENYVDERNVLFNRSLRFFTSLDLSESDQAPQSSLREELLSDEAPAPLPAPDKPSFQWASGSSAKRSKYAAPDSFLDRLDEPFSATLLRLIDTKGKTDVEVYKRANIDRKLFSKIRTGRKYVPGKKTAVALAIALELSLSETRDLLERAGFALSRSVMFDVIIEYFITHRRYDIYEINNVLFEYDQPLLGG